MADILASMSVRLGAETSGFQRDLAAAKKELRGFVQFGEGLKSAGEGLSKYVSAPLGLLGGLALKVSGDFESGFNRVQAATQASGTELEQLKEKAKDISLDPNLKFSASESAKALEVLAKNGVSVADILGGAADASTNLATATGGTLATAADITTDVMNNFGRSAKEAAALVDSITGTTLASKLSIDEYRLALGQAGGVAGPLGVKFEDFNAALAVTSSGFSSGSDAGTSFKTFLQRLVPQSNEAAAAIEKLGLNFFDAQGKMRPLREIAGELQRAFKGLSDQQKTELGTKIFGADSIRTALLLAKDGAEGFDKMAASIGRVNAAAQGAILNQGFAGGLEALKSAAEGAAIAIGESGLLGAADRLVRGGADLLTSFAKLDPVLVGSITTVAGLTAAVGPLLLGIGAVSAALPAITTGLTLLSGPVGIAVLGFAGLAAAVTLVAGNGEKATKTLQEQRTAVAGLEQDVRPLLARYDELKSQATLNKAEQEELRGIIEKVGAAIPTAITQFDAYGRAIDISTEAGRRFVEQQQAILRVKNKEALAEQREEYKRLTQEIDATTAALARRNAANQIVGTNLNRDVDNPFDPAEIALTSEQIAKLQGRLASLRDERKGVGGLIDELKGISAPLQQADADAKQLASTLSGNGGGLTEDMAKALQKLREALALNAGLSRALGVSYNQLAGEQSALEAGVKSLVAAGFDPAGKTVQRYAQRLNELKNVYADLSRLKPRLPDGVAEPKQEEKRAFDVDFNVAALPTTLPSIDITPLTSSLDAATARMAQFQLAGEMFSDNLNAVLVSGLQNTAVGIGEAVGDMISNAGGIELLGAALLSGIGGMAVQLGQLAIGVGIATAGIKAALQSLNPAAAIIGGIALVALGTAVKGAASKIGSGGGGSVGRVGGGFNPASAPATRTPEQRIKIELEPVTFRQKGPDLDAVVQVSKYRQLRTS